MTGEIKLFADRRDVSQEQMWVRLSPGISGGNHADPGLGHDKSGQSAEDPRPGVVHVPAQPGLQQHTRVGLCGGADE